MYADDTVIYYSDKNTRNIERIVNEEASVIQRWINENCLLLNLKKGKTEFVIYGSRLKNQPDCNVKINNERIYQPDCYEYLGLSLDNHLNLTLHYQKIYKRISSRIKLLAKIRHSITPLVAESIFTAMINPLFFYCYPIYSGISMTWKIKFQSLQNRAKSIINISNSLTWPTIESQRNNKILLDVFKSLHGLSASEKPTHELVNHRISTRGNQSLIRLPKIRTEADRKTTYYQSAKLFNSLNHELRNEQVFVNFKRKIKNHTFP